MFSTRVKFVGQHTEGHLGGDLRQRLRQEVRGTHPHLHRAKRMLDRLTARAHGVRIFVEPFLHGFDNLLVFPARNATLFARCTLRLDWAGLARIRPITVKFLTVLLSRRASASLTTSALTARTCCLHSQIKMLWFMDETAAMRSFPICPTYREGGWAAVAFGRSPRAASPWSRHPDQ